MEGCIEQSKDIVTFINIKGSYGYTKLNVNKNLK